MKKYLKQPPLIIVISIFGGCATNPPEPPSAAASYASWDNYQNDLAKYLNEKIGRPNNMRVVPASIVYSIGTVVRRDSMSELSSKCRLRSEAPKSVDGPEIPSVTAIRKIRFSLDPGSLIARAIPEVEAAKLSFDHGADLTASASDISTSMVPEDDTLAILQDPDCLRAVQDKPVSIVRGYIQAKYQVTGGGGVTPTAKITVLKSDLVDINFENSRKFEVKDPVPKQKFVILADGIATSEIVLSGGFLQSASHASGCREVPIVKFGKPAARERKGLGELRSYREFEKCQAAKAHIQYLCEKDRLEGADECKKQLSMWNIEASGYDVNYDNKN